MTGFLCNYIINHNFYISVTGILHYCDILGQEQKEKQALQRACFF